MGTVVAIMIGKPLGANDFDKARETLRQTIAFSVVVSTVIALILAVLAPLFPMLYNTTQEVRDIAAGVLRVVAISGIAHAFNHSSYFTLRSGGKTWITFLFDSAYLWLLSIPAARLLSMGTAWNILVVYAAVQSLELVKCALGYVLLKKKVWINRIV